MTDRPMIFSAPMIKALLDGRKAMTRRVLKPLPNDPHNSYVMWPVYEGGKRYGASASPDRAAPYAPGDRIWVREAWQISTIYDGCRSKEINPEGKPGWCGIYYPASALGVGIKKRSPIHMPRWASRLTLTVTDVRVERVQSISEDDAKAEGARPAFSHPDTENVYAQPRYVWGFHELWNSLHGPDAWARNDWVCVLTFRCEQRNIDAEATA